MRKTIQPIQSLKSVFLAFAILAFASSPAKAGMPVIDPSHIVTSILNTADQISKWASYINQFKGYYSTFNAVYHGINNWRDMDWLDMLKLTELPYFDNIPGIDDIRNIAAATTMTVEELQNIFADLAWFERMMNDPKYARNQALSEQMRIMRKCSQRQMRRKMVMTKALKTMQQENDKLLKQLKTIQTQIEAYSKQDPVPTASIMALQSRIANIQAKMQNNKDSLYAQIQAMQEQQEAELAQAQSQLHTVLFDLRQNNQAIRTFWHGYLK